MTMVPTLVVPPGTGGTANDDPLSVTPLLVSEALTLMGPETVGTPGIENEPSAAVVAVSPPGAETVAPATGALLLTTLPTTVVPGSGITLTTTLGAVPTFPPKSTAAAPIVREPVTAGTTKLYWYGAEVAAKTTLPLMRKLTAATA